MTTRTTRTENRENETSRPVNIGTSLFLLVFLILCLFTFAAISLASAHADLVSAEDTATRTADWYAACNTAEQTIRDRNAAALAAGTEPDATPLSIPAGDGRALSVTFSVGEDGLLCVETFESTDTTEWEATETLPVWNP